MDACGDRTNARRVGSKLVCARADSPREVPEGCPTPSIGFVVVGCEEFLGMMKGVDPRLTVDL